MRTLTTNFNGQKIVIHQHLPERGTPAGGDCFELKDEPIGDGDWLLGAVMLQATRDPRMVRGMIDAGNGVMLRPSHPDLPDCYVVYRDGGWLGDIERLPDGTWIGDASMGFAAPSQPFAARDEAIAWVLNPTGR